MKKILFILVMLISLTSFSQSGIKFTGIVKMADTTISASQIYSNCLSWMAISYKNSQRVLQLTDDKNYRIIAKALFFYDQSFLSGSATTKGVINYTIQIDCKDGKYRYEITNFTHDANRVNLKETYNAAYSFGLLTDATEYAGDFGWMTTKKWETKVWNDMKEQSKNYANELIQSIEKNLMSNNTNNNW